MSLTDNQSEQFFIGNLTSLKMHQKTSFQSSLLWRVQIPGSRVQQVVSLAPILCMTLHCGTITWSEPQYFHTSRRKDLSLTFELRTTASSIPATTDPYWWHHQQETKLVPHATDSAFHWLSQVQMSHLIGSQIIFSLHTPALVRCSTQLRPQQLSLWLDVCAGNAVEWLIWWAVIDCDCVSQCDTWLHLVCFTGIAAGSPGKLGETRPVSVRNRETVVIWTGPRWTGPVMVRWYLSLFTHVVWLLTRTLCWLLVGVTFMSSEGLLVLQKVCDWH